jgi:hypothetical protein
LITTTTHVIRFDDHYLPKQQHQDLEKLIAIPSESCALICSNSRSNRAISLVICCCCCYRCCFCNHGTDDDDWGSWQNDKVFQGFCLWWFVDSSNGKAVVWDSKAIETRATHPPSFSS